MMSSAASCMQVDPALLTKKLTIVAAVAISATALYLLFGGPRKRTKNEGTIIDCACFPDSSSCQEFMSADDQFQDIITITTTDHEQNRTEAYRCPHVESRCDSLHSSSGEASSAASGRLSSPKRACSLASSPLRNTFANCGTSVGVCTDPVRFRDQSHGICCSSQTAMSSYPDESPGVCNCCGEALPQDFPALQEPRNASFSDKRMDPRIKERENIPPPSRQYAETVSESGSSGIITSQNQKPDLGQKYGTANLSSSPLQQKKKVRWMPNTVEPSCDNQIYRRRQQQYTSNPSVPAQWPVASHEQPRLQSQATKNTITGTREVVCKNQYNYL